MRIHFKHLQSTYIRGVGEAMEMLNGRCKFKYSHPYMVKHIKEV